MLALMLTGAGMLLARPAIPRDPEIEKKVEATLKKMNLDQKVGQMLELNLDVFGHTDWSTGTPKWTLDEARLDTVIQKWQPGSFLNAPGTYAGSLEQWQYWIPTIQKLSMKYIGIPTIYGLDNNHGVTYVQGGIMFPQPINLAASFNTELAREMAGITAYESRAADCPWVYNPVTDLGRDPRWPRIWESFGEDPLVNARMAVAQVEGYQGPNPNKVGKYNVAACTKHYMCYGAPWTGKDRTPAYLSEQQIREKYFEPFRAQIMAGSLSIMVNSASINGEPVHASYKYLTQWLKKDLDWDGMIVTDWADINNLYTRDHIAKDKKEAIKLAINAGIDMSMDPYDWKFCTLLKELVEEGEVPMSRIDDAVRRILRMKYRLNLFEKPYYDVKDFPLFGSDEHAAVALQAAEESLVLLKNVDNLLPLAKGAKLLVTGPNANSMRTLNGGWSYSWQGDKADACAADYNTILEALTAKFGAENVTYEAGVTYKEGGSWWEENAPEIEKAVAAAEGVDCIVACIGENSYCETPGNLTDLTLSENQTELVKALARTGKPIILILNEGRPRLVARIEPLAKAVVDIMLPGNYGGDALANLLAGDANFSGKLPFTYPREINSLITYDYKPCEHIGKQMEGAYNYDAQVAVQWAFGYGKSYTDFAYSNFRVDKTDFTADDVLTFKVDVTNTGKRAGKESVLLFSSDEVASLSPDNRRLRAFEKIELQPGETKTVTLQLKGSDLAFVGYDGKWVLEKGDFRMQTGDQLLQIACSEGKKWTTPNR